MKPFWIMAEFPSGSKKTLQGRNFDDLEAARLRCFSVRHCIDTKRTIERNNMINIDQVVQDFIA